MIFTFYLDLESIKIILLLKVIKVLFIFDFEVFLPILSLKYIEGIRINVYLNCF